VKEIGPILALGLIGFLPTASWSQAREEAHSLQARIGIAGGMGVSYVNAEDVANLVSARSVSGERVSDFKAGAEFFGAVTVPFSSDWSVKAEYSYLIYSYSSTSGTYGTSEFTVTAHLPTIYGQYTLIDGGTYNVKAGLGTGYHIGSLVEKVSNIEERYTGKGIGAAVDLEANTAFSDNFYGYLGGNLRWDFIGRLTNELGRSPYLTGNSPAPTMNFFSAGARLGFTFYL
jgi:hypothetical protein